MSGSRETGTKNIPRQPRPLHHTFLDYRYTNRTQRRDKKLVKAALKDAIKAGDIRRYDGIREEVERRRWMKLDHG